MAYLTGDLPAGTCVVTMVLPSEPAIRRAVAGALNDLTQARHWAQLGSATPQDYADAIWAYWPTFTITCPDILTDENSDILTDENASILVE